MTRRSEQALVFRDAAGEILLRHAYDPNTPGMIEAVDYFKRHGFHLADTSPFLAVQPRLGLDASYCYAGTQEGEIVFVREANP